MFTQEQIQEIKENPKAMAEKAGFQIPDNLYGNPQAMVMHLIRTGQVSNPALQRIMPMVQRMMRI